MRETNNHRGGHRQYSGTDIERCGVKVEILGLPPAWKGDQSRELWQQAGKPAMQGG